KATAPPPARMGRALAAAAGVILPGTKLDVVAYGCTSAAIVIGEEKVFARIHEARPGVACTTPITAGIAGLNKLGAGRIALLTPYVDEVNQMFRRHVEEQGLAVPVMGSFNHGNDNEVARISQASIKDAVRELAREPGVDSVFVSCTSLRVADIAEDLEVELGKPVTSSNHALAWHCLRLAGINHSFPGLGHPVRIRALQAILVNDSRKIGRTQPGRPAIIHRQRRTPWPYPLPQSTMASTSRPCSMPAQPSPMRPLPRSSSGGQPAPGRRARTVTRRFRASSVWVASRRTRRPTASTPTIRRSSLPRTSAPRPWSSCWAPSAAAWPPALPPSRSTARSS